jgi:acid phosphatase type 7
VIGAGDIADCATPGAKETAKLLDQVDDPVLEAHRTTCTLAYWHYPLFSSGIHSDDLPKMMKVWRTLYAYGVDVVLNEHDHDYERFAPQNPDGKVDPVHGIREFVFGTGGAPQRHFRSERANSEVRNDHTWGVLKLTLHAASYD